MKEWWWKRRFSEYVLLAEASIFLALIVFLVFFGLTLLDLLKAPGVTPAAVLLATLFSSILGPVLFGSKVWIRRLDADLPEMCTSIPSSLLAKIRGIRTMTRVFQFIAVLVIVLFYLDNEHTISLTEPTIFSSYPVELGFLYFTFLEATLLCTMLSFWKPEPLSLLRALLLSPFSTSGRSKPSWMDDVVPQFNRLLKKRGYNIGIKNDVSLETVLFASPFWDWDVVRLLWSLDESRPQIFARELANVEGRSLPTIIEKVTLTELVKNLLSNLPSLGRFSPLLILVATYLSPIITNLDNQIVANWTHLYALMHL